ncbi:MAG TPA: LysM peptidoglycan-binding domain-containing protein [Phycisphaerae bacterium]|nr:LysM peptidoglycan-binding domain-containing protein [Phycisphaerae bacterium]
MRAFTWTVVVVMAVGVLGCAEKREEELPQINPAELEATVPLPATEATTPIPTSMVEVETPVPAVAATTASQTYTMQRGDTLYSLARRYYGDGKLWTRIAEANRSKIRDVTTIPVGTLLVIPPK